VKNIAFTNTLNDVELKAWNVFVQVAYKKFLERSNILMLKDIIENMLDSLRLFRYNMGLMLRYLLSQLDYIPDNFGEGSSSKK